VKDLACGGDSQIAFGGLPEHIGTGMTVEHKIALAIRPAGDKGERGTCFGAVVKSFDVDARVTKRGCKEMAKIVVADLTKKADGVTEPCKPDGYVGRCATGGAFKGARFGKIDLGFQCNEIDQKFAARDQIDRGHRPPSLVAACNHSKLHKD